MNKKTAALLALALLFSLAGCSGNSARNDVPSNNIESQAPSETPETPSEAIESTDPTQDPAQSEKPAEATQTPAESAPAESETPAAQPTKQPVQPAPSSAPVSTPAPTSPPAASAAPSTPAPTPAPTPTHTHSYSSAVTKDPTCAAEGVKTYTCSCGEAYTEAIAKTNDHSWATRHVAEVGHYESSGTHKVVFKKCNCGFELSWEAGDNNAYEVWKRHNINCGQRYLNWTEEVPNDPKYVVDTPAHDETYCTICGITQ